MRAAHKFLAGRRVRLLVGTRLGEGAVRLVESLCLFYYFAKLSFTSLGGLGRRRVRAFFSSDR